MPGFLLRYIKRVIHQDEINHFLAVHGEKHDYEFVTAVLDEFGALYSHEGLENIPPHGGCIIASNHPLGGLDGLALVNAVSKQRPDLKFIVNDLLMKIKNLNGLFLGVNKFARNNPETLAALDNHYASGGVMVIFPAGLVSRKNDQGKIRDLEWKRSFIQKSKQFQLPIVPTHISGRNSSFFYNLARWRQKLGLKANIEMFYLMDEMYHQRGKHIHIRFGKPIPPSAFGPEKTDSEWAVWMKEKVYSLSKE